MPLPNNFSQALRDLLWGTPWGQTFPPRDQPPQPPSDGRTVAMEILKRYIAELVFHRIGEVDKRTGQRGPTIPFQIPPASIHVEWPDHEEDLVFPSIALLSTGPADYAMIGLTSYIEEKSKDVFLPGTVLQYQYEHTETIAIEIWASKRSERRAILAGLEVALTPTEQMYGVRFRMPDYFGQLVCFSPSKREVFEEPDAARGRRRARVDVEMRFNVVALVNYNTLTVSLGVTTDFDEVANQPVVLDPNVPSGKLELFNDEPARPDDLPPLEPPGASCPWDDEP